MTRSTFVSTALSSVVQLPSHGAFVEPSRRNRWQVLLERLTTLRIDAEVERGRAKVREELVGRFLDGPHEEPRAGIERTPLDRRVDERRRIARTNGVVRLGDAVERPGRSAVPTRASPSPKPKVNEKI
jgi:hypothetical protein